MIDYRQHAHQLIDRLPESHLTALVGLLETIVDPVPAALRYAPSDDEEETYEERAAMDQHVTLCNATARSFRTSRPCGRAS